MSIQKITCNDNIEIYYISNSMLNENTIENINKNTIGFVAICIQQNQMTILNMHVNKKFRNNGYGSKLLKHVIFIALSKNIDKITLDDMTQKAWCSQNMYVKHGFNYVNGYPYPEMELKFSYKKIDIDKHSNV